MSKKRRKSPKEKQAKINAAKKTQEAQIRAKEKRERKKKILTIVVCVILVLGLSVPTMALTVCSDKSANNTQQVEE